MKFLQVVVITALILPSVLLDNNSTEPSASRGKRALIFPRGNPTRHQLVAGLGIPVDVVLESITVGYVFKAVYFLPWNSSHWIPQFLRRDEDLLFEPPELQQQQQQRRNFVEVEPEPERNRVEESAEDDDNWTRRSRWQVYRMLEALADQKGYNGRACLLRTICEAAEAKFSHSSGVLGELLHILFSPSTTDDEPLDEDEVDSSHEEYKRAETLAHRYSPRRQRRFAGSSVCSDMFVECPFSLLDLFSGIL